MTDSPNNPRTASQWLALGDEELGMKLAEVFIPEPWKHCGTNVVPGVCNRCGNKYSPSTSCIAPDPIDIKDWNVAMERRDKGDDEEFYRAMQDICVALIRKDVLLIGWVLFNTQPKHYLIAAALAQGAKE